MKPEIKRTTKQGKPAYRNARTGNTHAYTPHNDPSRRAAKSRARHDARNRARPRGQ
jgi:hypothetical protein